jgi:hypothetical protein
VHDVELSADAAVLVSAVDQWGLPVHLINSKVNTRATFEVGE